MQQHENGTFGEKFDSLQSTLLNSEEIYWKKKKNWALIRNNSQQRDAVIYFWIKILADISIRSKWEKTSKNRKGQKKSKEFWKSKNKVLLWNRKADQMFSKLHEIIASLTRAKKSKKMCTSKI